MTVYLPERGETEILTQGIGAVKGGDGQHEAVLAFYIGTTTLVGFLLDGASGALLASASAVNPQIQYGADVISCIQTAVSEKEPPVCHCCAGELTEELVRKAGIDVGKIGLACVVGNTAMHHLFLGIDPSSLITPPYMPAASAAI